MQPEQPTVFVIDDDEGVRKAITLILRQAGHCIQSFASAAEFLAAYDASMPGCVVSDVRMPGLDGMELLAILSEKRQKIPVIMLSAHGDIPMAVSAVKTGAVDFLQKPAEPEELRERVAKALELDREWRLGQDERIEIVELLSLLTPREREVLNLLVDGKDARIISVILGTSHNTVRVQRASIMKKMRADNVTDLVRMMHIAEDSGAR